MPRRPNYRQLTYRRRRWHVPEPASTPLVSCLAGYSGILPCLTEAFAGTECKTSMFAYLQSYTR